MFKRIPKVNVRSITALLIILALALSLTACGGSSTLKGTYKSEGLISQTWTFTGTNEVKLSAVGGLVATSGTYTISGDKITVTSHLLNQETVTSYTFENRGNTLIIDGVKYVRQ